MKYVSVTFNPSMEVSSPEAWFRRTEPYSGILFCLAKNHAVINIKQIGYEGIYPHQGLEYHFVNFGKDTLFPRRLIRYVKNLEPDVVLVQGLHNPLQLIQLARQLNDKVKIIVQHHAEKPFSGLKKYLQKFAGRYVDAYLFASNEMGAEWIRNGNLSSAKKIHEVMEVSSVFSRMNKTQARMKTGVSGEPVFLWVGRLNDNKDPMTVVNAFFKFAAQNPAVRLYMIYHTGELLSQIKNLLQKSPQKDNVVLVGKVPHYELLYWFNSADIILSGSHYEGSGTAICEAMSCGCMPVVTDIASFRMITDNGKCGLLYSPGSEDALLSALQQTTQMNIAEKQQRSLQYFRSNLSFEAIAGRIEQVVASLS
ncbi:MAG: glycosyltransferase family 4 protein [Bacteroidetes bacterium]|nr:glycosyltransferase family 4 protein [Bacteroidota bacterium]